MKKAYTIIRHLRYGGTKEIKGTISELTKYFSNLLSWWEKPTPKQARTLVNALNECVSIQQGCCYNRDYYVLKEK